MRKLLDQMIMSARCRTIFSSCAILSFIFLTAGCTRDQGVGKNLVSWQLRGLVKEIEFYRLVYAAYPQSLKDLSRDDVRIEVVDLFGQDDKRPCSYVYARSDTANAYILRSVGPDGKAMTDDDVFPDLSEKEIGAVGWKVNLGQDAKGLQQSCR